MVVSQPNFPSITPSIIGGKWENGKLLLDPFNPDIRISPWNGSGNIDRLEWGYWSASGGAGGASSTNLTRTNINLGWGNLRDGDEYQVYIYYVNVESQQTNFDILSHQENPNPILNEYNARVGSVSALNFTVLAESSGELEIIEATFGNSDYYSPPSYNVTGILQSRITKHRLFRSSCMTLVLFSGVEKYSFS